MDFVKIADLAADAGVSRQAILFKVNKLRPLGLVVQGRGKAMKISASSFRELSSATTSPARVAGAKTVKRRLAEAAASAATVATAKEPSQAIVLDVPAESYDEAATREKNAKAALAEMQVAQRRGELVQVADIEAAASEAATATMQAISALKTKAGQLYAAGVNGGEEGLHVVLVKSVDEALGLVADAMKKLAARGTTEAG